VVEEPVTVEWRALVSRWLVEADCLFMMAWGHECSLWDDSVDFANLERFDFGDVPDRHFVMTTWHEKESLNEVFWFAKHAAYVVDSSVEVAETVIFHVSRLDQHDEYARLYAAA
jgi:hypothetical protein